MFNLLLLTKVQQLSDEILVYKYPIISRDSNEWHGSFF